MPMANPRPYYRINLEEIAARNQTARRMIAGFAAEMPLLADFWRHLDTALADNLTLSAELAQLTAELATTRMDRANLLAAIRATLAAYADGEADPLSYLRDELDARQMPFQGHRRAS
jgi:predicted DNA-binding ribbon-helix-helix protein